MDHSLPSKTQSRGTWTCELTQTHSGRLLLELDKDSDILDFDKIEIRHVSQLVKDLDTNRTRQGGLKPNTTNTNSVLTLLRCSAGMHVHVKGTWGQHKAHEVSSAACENQLNIAMPSSVHLYSLTRSMKENTWQQHVSLTLTTVCSWEGKKENCMAWEPDTQADISRLCVFRNGCCISFFIISLPAPWPPTLRAAHKLRTSYQTSASPRVGKNEHIAL